VTNPACLSCHTTPDMAPATMIKHYGPANGFGWKLNDIIGVQVVSVPMTLPIRNAERAFFTFIGSLAAVFLLVFVVLNVMLSRMIVQPISHMSHVADQVSTGNFDIPEFAEAGKDEIAVLGVAFNRMRRSLQKALSMIES
jgi:protein-histidine pros-kinase